MADTVELSPREQRVAQFREKNARRKAGRTHGSFTRSQRREARELRKICSGAFGWRKAQAFNERIPGTLGEPRDPDGEKLAEMQAEEEMMRDVA